MMLHVFVLIVQLNGAVQQTAPMYFYDIDRCIYFAKRIGQQKNYSAYCKLSYVNSDTTQIYK